jgi:hypothetical protein
MTQDPTDVWTVVVTVAQRRSGPGDAGSPCDPVDIWCHVVAHHSTDARLIACQMASIWGVMPIADRVVSVVC